MTALVFGECRWQWRQILRKCWVPVALAGVLAMATGGLAQEVAPLAPAPAPATPAPNPLAILVKTLGKIEAPAVQLNILKGMNASLKGKRGIPAPQGWDALMKS